MIVQFGINDMVVHTIKERVLRKLHAHLLQLQRYRSVGPSAVSIQVYISCCLGRKVLIWDALKRVFYYLTLN